MDKLERAILAKLREQNVKIGSATDKELKKAFSGTVSPTYCFKLAKRIKKKYGWGK